MEFKSVLLALVAIASTTNAQSTTTATVLLPGSCVTQSRPAVSIVGQANGLTTYSYSCSINSAALASASSKASKIIESAERWASSLESNLLKPIHTLLPKREELEAKRDNSGCYGYRAYEACIPWQVTQGPSYWAVHVTAVAVLGVDQTCTFGEGGLASGAATCTASGELDPTIWKLGGGKHTETFAKTDIDRFFFRQTVVATSGGPAATTGAGATAGAAGVNNVQSPGFAAPRSLPTGAAALMAGAGGILVAALAL